MKILTKSKNTTVPLFKVPLFSKMELYVLKQDVSAASEKSKDDVL